MPLLKRGSPSNAVSQGINTQATTVVTVPPSTIPTKVRIGGTREAGSKASVAANTMTKADWANKDRRISRQGLFQAALQSVGILQLNTGSTLEDYLKLVEQVVERGLEFVNKE
jgi:hypothetical protein